MKIAIIGAGGIGGYIGGRLAEAGKEVALVARGQHLAAIQSNGLKIESPHGNAHVTDVIATDRVGDVGPVDLVVVTVKMPDLEKAAVGFSDLVQDNTRFITLQNGIDAKSVIGAHVNPERIAQGVIYLAAYISEPGTIMTPGGKYQMFVDGLGGDATMTSFFDAIGETVALDATPVDDGDKLVWSKFVAQASIAAVTSITRLPLGGVFASAEATHLLEQLLDEAIAVSVAAGIRLDEKQKETAMALYKAQPGAQSSSLLVDIQSGKPNEVEWLSRKVHSLGQELGVPTPAHSTAWAALAPYKDGPPTILP
ncbi:MAG: 2-dehydropantoate 2-reductase [Boseongicola sp.]|nr:2-dehydropantoate 2-reductase [Boseongicola sp.]MDD9976991.1 2-dehydropantoate 2-reductase [Boseongicola sp.]